MSIETSTHTQFQSESLPVETEILSSTVTTPDQLSAIKIPGEIQVPRRKIIYFTAAEIAALTDYDRARYTEEELAVYTPEQLDQQVYCDTRRSPFDPIYEEGLQLSLARATAERRFRSALLERIIFFETQSGLRPEQTEDTQIPLHILEQKYEDAGVALDEATKKDIEFRAREASFCRDGSIRSKR